MKNVILHGWSFGLSLCMIGPVFSQSTVEMEEVAEKIHILYSEIVLGTKDFRLPEGGVQQKVGENLIAYQQAMEAINKTRAYKASNQAFLDQAIKTYAPGVTEHYKIQEAFNEKFKPLRLGYDVGDDLRAILTRFEYLEKAPENNAFAAIQDVKAYGTTGPESMLQYLNEMFRVKAIEESLAILDFASRFVPDNEMVARRLEKLQPDVQKTLEEYREKERVELEKRKWPGSSGDARIADAGKAFLQSQSDWGGNTKRQTKILKVAPKGDWFVAEKNLLGQPLRYGFPVYIVIQDIQSTGDIVTVYEASLITHDPQKTPNFYGVWVGNVFRMLKKNVP